MRVQLFIPCFVDQLYPQTAFNTIKILERAGCTVRYNAAQTCCGQPAFNAGFWAESKAVCSKFLNDFSAEHYIVSPSASCVGFVRNYYKNVFENDAALIAAARIGKNIFELSDFLVNVLKQTDFGATLHATATYHDSCAGLRECGIKAEPRQLLNQVKGLQVTELEDVETCCGFGGTFAVKFEAVSTAMAEQKVEHALATKADVLVSTDLSCLMHLQGYINQKGYTLQTMHLADVLASGW